MELSWVVEALSFLFGEHSGPFWTALAAVGALSAAGATFNSTKSALRTVQSVEANNDRRRDEDRRLREDERMLQDYKAELTRNEVAKLYSIVVKRDLGAILGRLQQVERTLRKLTGAERSNPIDTQREIVDIGGLGIDIPTFVGAISIWIAELPADRALLIMDSLGAVQRYQTHVDTYMRAPPRSDIIGLLPPVMLRASQSAITEVEAAVAAIEDLINREPVHPRG